jgi:hypothetical protein
VLRILVFALFAFALLSWLGIAALSLVALKREGAKWSRHTRSWFRLKAAEQVLLVVFVGIAAVGFPRWALLVMAIVFPVLWVARRRARREAERSPGWINGS